MKRIALTLACLLALSALPAHAEGTDIDVFYDDGTEIVLIEDEGDVVLVDEDPTAAPPTDFADPWPRTIVITVGGDCTLGCTDAQRASSDGFAAAVKKYGYAHFFSGLYDVFSRDDLTLVNFEGTLTESNDKAEKKFNFKGPAEYAQILTEGSVEAVTLANNHFIDYGAQGKEDTMTALDAHGVVYCAPNQPGVFETRGVKIGLIGNTFPYKDGKRDISGDVKALREAGCQIIIASFHWGSEYETAFSRDQRNIGRAALNAGADAVVGHHPHIIQGIEAYEDSYILYSLGNLVFGGNRNPERKHRDTYVAQFAFTVHEDGTVDKPILKIIPARLTSLADGTDYRPVIAVDSYERILGVILGRSHNMEGFENPR